MTDGTKVPATPEEAEAALKAAFELGRAAAQAEGEPDLYEFSNGFVAKGRGNLAEYMAAISAKTFELQGRGVRNVKDHPDIAEIKREFGRG